MKRKVILYSLLMASAAAFVQCSDDESTEKKECYPVELPAEEGIMKLAYNDSHLVTDIDFVNHDEPESQYTMKLEYSNGRVSKINYYEGETLDSYTTFGYFSEYVMENHLYKNEGGDFITQTIYYYYRENDNIVAKSTYYLGEGGFYKSDSAKYSYNNAGNITLASYYSGDVIEYTAEFTYDDKVNPYKISGLPYGDSEFFTPKNLSTNNATRAVYAGDNWTEEETVTFTYDADGKPITHHGSWEDGTYDIKWNCQ